jgi:hypothetical protein
MLYDHRCRDDAFRKQLADAILAAIAETSLHPPDGHFPCVHVERTRDALVDCLITLLSGSFHYDVHTGRLDEFTELLAKRLRREVRFDLESGTAWIPD